MFRLSNALRFATAALFLSACRLSYRDPNWEPKPSEKMLRWFSQLNYSGFKGPTPYDLGYPSWYINRAVMRPDMSHEAVELGRFLFYDRALSSDSSVACASCHKQKNNFSDDKRFSIGVKGRATKRNSMQLVNLVSDERFFWDGRAASLEAQALIPIESPTEMDLPLAELIDRLSRHPVYPALFERAYGSREITSQRIADAIAQFVKSIVSYSSHEEYFRAVIDKRLQLKDVPKDIVKYYPLYLKTASAPNCGACHSTALSRGQRQFENVMPENTTDLGYYEVTKKEEDKGKFKVPALRNLAVTGPYMHDGSVSDLRAALSHYRAGRPATKDGYISPYRDERGNLKTDPITEKTLDIYVITFSLNADRKVLTDPKYADPF